MIAAILQAQFRSMVLFGRGSVLTIVAAVLWYGMWTLAGGAVGFWTFASSPAQLDSALPLGLLAILFYWQLIPLFSASMGSSLDLRKLLAYPIPHGKLFRVEVLLRFTTGIEAMLVLTGGTFGLLLNPALHGAPAALRLLCAVAVYVAFNLLLASGMRSVIERLLSRRRVREWLAFFMAMIWVLPRFLAQSGVRPKWLLPAIDALHAVGFPWTAASHAAFDSGGHSIVLAFASLAAWTLAAAWFGRSQFERNLRFDPQAAQSTPLDASSGRGATLVERFYRLPSLLWRDPVAGMVEKELRSLARTPRFRMVFVMGFTFGLMLWLPMVMGSARHSSASRYFLTLVCVYALTLLGGVTYWNCFGFDRSAALFYFAAPLPMTQVLIAKNIAAMVYVYLEVSVLSAITVLLRTGIGGAQIVETMAVMGIATIYMLALGNVSSVNYPRALHAERVSQGRGGGFQGLLFLLYPLALIPILLAYLARYALASQIAFVLVLALAAAIGAVLYKIALDSAVASAATHRERLIQELSKGEGPLVAG